MTESESDESERFHVLPIPLLIRSSDNQIVGVGRRSGRINQSQRSPSRLIKIVKSYASGFDSHADSVASENQPL